MDEVSLVCAIDFFTGAVLLNAFVYPLESVRKWDTQTYGIASAAMNEAVSEGHALNGWAEARAELWNLIDQNTIIVGHALLHDLNILGMVHTRIVDSAMLVGNEIGTSRGQLGLQKLCKELLGLDIRTRIDKRGLHDCLEDVLATREVVLWCTQNQPKFEVWAKTRRLELNAQEKLRRKTRKGSKRSAALKGAK